MENYNGYSIYQVLNYNGEALLPNYMVFTDNPLWFEDITTSSISGEYKFDTLAEAKKFVDNLLSTEL